jgi:hypothetical protein
MGLRKADSSWLKPFGMTMLMAECFFANPENPFHVSLMRGSSNGNQDTFSQKNHVDPRWEFQEKIERAPLRQEGERRSTHGDAPHAVGQAPGEEPQTGDRDRAFEGAQEGREGSGKKFKQEEGGVASLCAFCSRISCAWIPRLLWRALSPLSSQLCPLCPCPERSLLWRRPFERSR